MKLDDIIDTSEKSFDDVLALVSKMSAEELDNLMHDIDSGNHKWNDQQINKLKKAYLRRSLQVNKP